MEYPKPLSRQSIFIFFHCLKNILKTWNDLKFSFEGKCFESRPTHYNIMQHPFG